ncbi:hypothetical protein LJR235_003557 [Pararhizobium sp. LjRoot235]|uniref:hypothetical protein n=1 Tax=Pararhizobium sp. LjRoot235 TaxID=3342291 RepID=UPI003ECCDD7B
MSSSSGLLPTDASDGRFIPDLPLLVGAQLIFDKNSARRDLTTGQKALAYALLYPEKEKPGPKAVGQSFPTNGEIPTQRIADARAIVKYAPGDIEAIKQGDERDGSGDALS